MQRVPSLIILHTDSFFAVSKDHIIFSGGWIKTKMKWEKSKKEETKVHESHFSMFQTSFAS